MESFMESLNRLKDIHEKEVLGLQNKLLELNSERCRDAQRVEELCAKNHQLREQQKALKDNVRVLENRLRAGLCDRCTVTQELARKKQQEFESSLLQNLQHLFILTNEMTRLQEENETLKEEVARLRGLGPKPQCRESSSDPSSPPLLISPGPWKTSTEKLPGGHEEAEDHPLEASPQGEEKLEHRMSPVAKISPGANLPEPRASDMSPQRISNQLHGTIAVVRPGAWACSADRGSANGTPSAQSSPTSPPYEHSLSLDSFLRASQASARPHKSLKHALQTDRLCLLNRPRSLHLRSPQSSPRAPAAAPGGPQPQILKAREAEAWEVPSGLLGPPGTLVDMRDPRLEGALSLLLAQQLQARGQAGGARMRGPPRPGETPPSPPICSDSEGSEGEVAGAALPRRRHQQPTGPGSPRGQEATATEDLVPDKPLDLSEWGRGRDAPKPVGRPRRFSPKTAHTPSPEPPQGAKPLAQSGPWGRSNGTKGTRAPGPEAAPLPEDSPHPLPEPQPSLPSPGRTGDESRERPKPSPHPQSPDANGHPVSSSAELLPLILVWQARTRPASTRLPGHQPGLTHALHPAELSKAQAQRPLSDKLDEPDASDSEPPRSCPEGEGTPGEPLTPAEGPRSPRPQGRRPLTQQQHLGRALSCSAHRGQDSPHHQPSPAQGEGD
ncbi:PREDICTED: RBBP8 N-terminal-like protein isoform X1 [Myotis brandtii]|uniref:RBBP8 N-terminal-like protein isoform X1 n=1 Tax=Myotis brandtii TaxID=109478 RepID=UPI0007047929|nr:PREDICTED: RBBP8 N-terminal-like protein isoform X1 [Myotis brandtii]